MMPLEMIAEQIHAYIVRNFLFDTGDVEYTSSLIGEGILDSTGVLEMVMFVEETFGTSVAEDEVVPENFDSIESLATFVAQRQTEPPSQLAS